MLRRLPVLYERQTLASLPHHIVQFVSSVISADALAYNEVNLKTGRAYVAMTPGELVHSPYLKAFERFMDQHPLVVHQRATGDMSARKISDFLSPAQFHRTPIYNEVYRHLGAEDQIAFSLQLTHDTIVAVAINRARRNFTEGERQFLNLLQPHLIQAFRNAEALTLLQNELRALRGAVENLSSGLMVLDGRVRIQFATERAKRLLKKYFLPSGGILGSQLPKSVKTWLRRSCNWQGQLLPNATNTFSVKSASGTLTLRRMHENPGTETLLLLDESGGPLSARPLEALGLTPRQAEVLLWVAQGKSNPEIAIILGTATKTVQKHLEAVFAKLGVESRTAAARRALETLHMGRLTAC